MEEPIFIKYECLKFDCKYSSDAVSVMVRANTDEYRKEAVQAPKCDKCGDDMQSDIKAEIEQTLWNAGIKY